MPHDPGGPGSYQHHSLSSFVFGMWRNSGRLEIDNVLIFRKEDNVEFQKSHTSELHTEDHILRWIFQQKVYEFLDKEPMVPESQYRRPKMSRHNGSWFWQAYNT